MLKILLMALAIWIIFSIARPTRATHSRPPDEKDGDIVPCEHCGVHIPITEAINNDGHFFCCEAHIHQRSKG